MLYLEENKVNIKIEYKKKRSGKIRNYILRNKDIMTIIISICSLLVTIFIAIKISSQQLEISKKQAKLSDQNLKLSEQNSKMNSQNLPLIYDTKIKYDDLGESSSFDFEDKLNTIEFKMSIKPEITQGNIKAVFSCVYNGNEVTINSLNSSKFSEVKLDYKTKGTTDQLNKSVMDMFVVYIDNNNKLHYDYVLMMPEYFFHRESSTINDETTSATGAVLNKINYRIINQFELVGDNIYEKLKKENDMYIFTDKNQLLEHIKIIKNRIREQVD